MVNSPLPTDLAGECRKAAKTLNAFIDPVAAKGPDKVIPADILQRAKGFAIFTVIKAGFLFSGRAGSGLVVARLSDGSWSAPSAIGIGGMGFGGQIGAEMTDFVIVLNSKDAVASFANGGNVTLGGNLSVAAGPVGRTAEGAGSVSLKHVAAIFSYSKTKGLFAGVSIEGSVVLERKDANAKFYHRKVTAKQLLTGEVGPPRDADILYTALNLRASRTHDSATDYVDSSHNSSSSHRASTISSDRSSVTSRGHDIDHYSRPPPPYSAHKESETSRNKLFGSAASEKQRPFSYTREPTRSPSNGSTYKPPIAPKPNIPPRRKEERAVALYDFDAQQDDDLSFMKDDIIIITKKTDSTNDWWTGRANGREGNFPANYVQLL